MKMYADFLKETCGRSCFYDDNGFVTYYMKDSTIVIDDMFITKEKRGSKLRLHYYNVILDIAKENECKYVTSVINKHSSETTQIRTEYILKDQGFDQYTEDEYMKYFSKEII